jgi:hypothetical protein
MLPQYKSFQTTLACMLSDEKGKHSWISGASSINPASSNNNSSILQSLGIVKLVAAD